MSKRTSPSNAPLPRSKDSGGDLPGELAALKEEVRRLSRNVRSCEIKVDVTWDAVTGQYATLRAMWARFVGKAVRSEDQKTTDFFMATEEGTRREQ
jgi:hypothetical protein